MLLFESPVVTHAASNERASSSPPPHTQPVQSPPCPLSEVLRRDGFVVIRKALPRAVCAAVRADLQAELGEEDPPGGEDGRLNLPLGGDSSAMGALARVVADRAPFFTSLLGRDGQLRTLGALVSLPSAATQQIHSDMDWVPDTLFATGLVALQDVSLEMGPTVLYAGTHTEAFHAARRAYTARVGPQVAVSRDDPLAARAHAPLAMTLGAGDMVVFDTRVFHHGTRNVTTARRMLLCFSFLAAGSDRRNIPGYFQFLATPDIREGQYLVRDLIPPPVRARRDEPPPLLLSHQAMNAPYWEGLRELRLREDARAP